MNRYYIYEGTKDSRDESDSFATKAAAIGRAKIAVQNAKDMDLSDYVAHVIDRKTGEFVYTEYFDKEQPEALSCVGKAKINTSKPVLYNYDTGKELRNATAEELAASIDAAGYDGGRGVIEVDETRCYVV
jgi:hypothetical protein